jgi:hypothetical protein
LEEVGPLVVGLSHVEVVGFVCQLQNLDTVLEIGPIGSEMGTALPLQGLLVAFILGV